MGIKENIEESSNKKTNTIEKNSFRENIELKQDEEEQKILKLQKEYKLGNIREEDMTDEEHQKLIALYEKQNKILEEKINTKKTIIRKKIDELKAS